MRAREVNLRRSALVIFGMAFLAVTFGEFMTGGISATPFSLLGVFLIPPFVAVSLTYGIGVLLVREASVRWNRGWLSVLLLGAANAWILQGIFTKVLFGPSSSPDIMQFGVYGRWLGVNWLLAAVAVYLDGFLATVVPIFLTNELIPQIRGRRLLSDLAVAVTVGIFLPLLVWEDVYINADNNVLPSSAHPFVSALGPVQLALWLAIVLGLALIAWRVPRELLRPRTELPMGSPWEFLGLGVAATIGTLVVEGFGWRVVPWPAALLAVYAAAGTVILWIVRQRIGRVLNLPQRVALVAGALAPFAFLDVFLEASGDYLVLPIAVGVFTLLAFLWRAEGSGAPPRSAPPNPN
jgi:hypothetical protein